MSKYLNQLYEPFLYTVKISLFIYSIDLFLEFKDWPRMPNKYFVITLFFVAGILFLRNFKIQSKNKRILLYAIALILFLTFITKTYTEGDQILNLFIAIFKNKTTAVIAILIVNFLIVVENYLIKLQKAELEFFRKQQSSNSEVLDDEF